MLPLYRAKRQKAKVKRPNKSICFIDFLLFTFYLARMLEAIWQRHTHTPHNRLMYWFLAVKLLQEAHCFTPPEMATSALSVQHFATTSECKSFCNTLMGFHLWHLDLALIFFLSSLWNCSDALGNCYPYLLWGCCITLCLFSCTTPLLIMLGLRAGCHSK